jgi:N-acetylated-alpha-linked acidic dipeptidase
MQIISRMKGTPVPKESPAGLDKDLHTFRGWQGGLPLTYRLTGGPDLKLHLMVKQERAITKTANVIAALPGTTWPSEKVILGCHHDAWGFGAADPLAGLMVLMESARSFAELAKAGLKPARTIVFAAWGAEEFGIVGSTEWVEANRDDLLKNAVAYVNLDMAAMGPDFGASATPSLRALVEDVVRAVPQARSGGGGGSGGGGAQTVSNAWRLQARNKGQDQPVIGTMGGGSDHVGFVCHLAVPSVSFGASGGEGTSYHSNYDTLAWYRKVVGDDYEPALMLARIVNLFAARLANADVLPLDPTVWATELRAQLKTAEEYAMKRGMKLDYEHLLRQIDDLEIEAQTTATQLAAALSESRLNPGQLGRINQGLIALERAWLDPEGIPERPWFANLYVSSDPSSGYAALMLPKVMWGIDSGDAKAMAWSLLPLYDTVQRMGERLAEVRAAIVKP